MTRRTPREFWFVKPDCEFCYWTWRARQAAASTLALALSLGQTQN